MTALVPPRSTAGAATRGGPAALLAARVLFPLLLVAGWQLLAVVLANPVFPAPAQAAADLVTSLRNPRFLASAGDTLAALGVAFSISAVTGIVLGSLLGLSRLLHAAIAPIIYGLNSVPKIVLYPIFLLVLGLGFDSRVAFAAFHGLFATVLIMMEAAAGLDPVYRKLAGTYRLTRGQVVRHLVLPALLPQVATACRLCFGLVFIALIVAELFSATTGLGYEIVRLIQIADLSRIVGVVAVTFVIAVVPTAAMRAVEQRLHGRYSR